MDNRGYILPSMFRQVEYRELQSSTPVPFRPAGARLDLRGPFSVTQSCLRQTIQHPSLCDWPFGSVQAWVVDLYEGSMARSL